MDIIVDSNIIFSDPMMRSQIWQQLWTHLKKSSCVMLVPEVVKKECISNHLQHCDKYRGNIVSAAAKLGRLIGQEIEVELPSGETDAPAYLARWEELLIQGRVRFLPNPGAGALEDLQNRAIKRLPPFDVKGNGFRDGTIWLSVRNHVRNKNVDTAFISNDRTAYCAKESGGILHPHLQSEIGTAQLLFFTDIGKFLEVAGEVPVNQFVIEDKA